MPTWRPINLGKTLEYFKIQESLGSENLTEYHSCKEIFLCLSLPWKILYKHKVKQIIELAKTLWLFTSNTFRRNFLHSKLVSIQAWISFAHSEGSRRAPRHSSSQGALRRIESTWELGHLEGTQRALGHSAIKALRHLST